MTIVWDRHALQAFYRLSIPDAARIDRAVQRWAATGEGAVHASEGGAFMLYVDVYVVEFFLDVNEQTMHVDRVRRA